MLIQTSAVVVETIERADDLQELLALAVDETEPRRLLNYVALTGRVAVGDAVILNVVARSLELGTGGYDFVTASPGRLKRWTEGKGHILKGRYLPCQHAVLTLEEQITFSEVWGESLDSFPVLIGQLHSQIAPAAAALTISGKERIAYIMTDQAALPMTLSNLVRELKAAGLLHTTLTAGQAFGGDDETVTLHSALIAAKHIRGCDAAIVCQGPGNAGTGTRYGFSGIEQAQNLDIVSALGGTPIAIVRMSSADTRERHQGLSHHTRTTLELAHSRCIVPLPAGTDVTALSAKHDIRFVEGTEAALDLLDGKNIHVTTMGRTHREDPDFFRAAAAAGLVVP
jgi:hypothetical protein